jgi:hypothetical protein
METLQSAVLLVHYISLVLLKNSSYYGSLYQLELIK